jgi:hypothetical protein
METDRATVVACIPSAIPAEDRAGHFALARKLFGELALEKRELADGYAFRFQPRDFDAVVRFVANERKCCPFMSFDLAVPRELGP